MNHEVASPSDCVNIIECIYTNEMAVASPGNIILWESLLLSVLPFAKMSDGACDSILISTYDLENHST